MKLEYTIEQEQSLVDELRRRMKGLMKEEMFGDDSVFQRFLRARNHNIDAAEEMLRNHLAWRKQNKVETALTDYHRPEVLVKYMALNKLGFDKEGSPINYCEIGNIDLPGLKKCVKKQEVYAFFMHFLEKDLQLMKQQQEKLGKPVDKWTYIFNYENFSLYAATDKLTIETLIHLIKMYDANYPERIKAGYLVNASFYFHIIWAILKPFIAPETYKKIKIFGKDGWQEKLAEYLGAENMPKFLGGTVTDPDGNPRCNSFISHGGIIPKMYYVNGNRRKSFSFDPSTKRMLVHRKSKTELFLEVIHEGSTIEWEFDVTYRDIAFAVYYKENLDSSTELEEIFAKSRLDTRLFAESGMYKCDKAGFYILEFDNTYSWMYNKEILYKTAIIPPALD